MTHVVDLPSGQLRLSVERADYPLEELCGFGCRANRRRPFVIVSRVLGKHVPIRPKRMAEFHDALAQRLPEVPGPVAFIALAETAVGLGHGIFENWLTHTGRDDTVFLHTTRYRLCQRVAFEFQETHSHAPCHLVYEPIEPRCRELFTNARTLVLIDDELTTGQTLINLAIRYLRYNDRLRQVVFVCLTDWLGQRRQRFARELGVPLDFVSLLRGALEFVPNSDFEPPPMPDAFASGSLREYPLMKNAGRLGVNQKISLNLTRLREQFVTPLGKRLLVLGTGEFMYPPFLLAQALEKAGHEVFFQSTTRSPLLAGGALGQRLEFMDNYGEGVPNYLYNAQSVDVDNVIIAYESLDPKASHDLPRQLKAQCVLF